MERISIIVAHPDDVELWAGGLLINMEYCAQISILYLNILDSVRKNEAQLAACLLNAEVRFYNKGTDINEQIIAFLVEFRPTILLTHWEGDTHPEHTRVYWSVMRILPIVTIENRIQPNVFSMDTYNNLGKNSFGVFTPTHVIDISNVWEKKLRLLDIYQSQPTNYWKQMIESQNRITGARAGVKYAESFIQIPILGVLRNSKNCLGGHSYG